MWPVPKQAYPQALTRHSPEVGRFFPHLDGPIFLASRLWPTVSWKGLEYVVHQSHWDSKVCEERIAGHGF
jgi:hypothetical protein